MKNITLKNRFAPVGALLCAALALLNPFARAGAAPPLPAIYAFNVAAEATINLGTTTSLNWSVGDATKVTLTPDFGDVTNQTSVNITPTTTTTYILTAMNSTGSVTKSKKITVVIPPVVDAFAALPSSIDSGATTTLTWSAPGASYYIVTSDVGAAPGQLFTTSAVVKPTSTTVYTVTAKNTAGSGSRSTTVTVTAPLPKPVIASFTASPTSVVTGGAATLNWSVTGATSLSISPGIGAVTGSSATIHPAATTTYKLTATNASGSVTKNVSVTVSSPTPTPTPSPSPSPVIATFAASPGTISLGASTTLTWSASNFKALSISASVGASPGSVSGTGISVSPTTNTIYTLTATNGVGSATMTAAVTVAGPAAPTIGSFTASPAFIQNGGSSTLSWSVAGAMSLAVTADVGSSPGTVTGTSISVSPTATTNYTLTAINATGSRTAIVPVTLYSPGNSNVVHPRIWVTPATAITLSQRAMANDPAWIKLRNDCDAYVAMPINFPDQDPSSNTINGGYQYNDYLQPSEELALGYLVAKIADPVRAANYATKERQLLLALSDPVHHGRPTTDSGYSIRSYVPALALGYDWIFDTLNDADRVQIYTEINRWVASFDSSGFGRNFPQGNYFAGYYCGKALGALATEGENPNGPTMWNDWLNRIHYGMVQPYHAQWLSGGGAPDGWNYGPFETINLLRPIAAAFTAKGLDLIHDPKPFAYPDGHARWMTQFTWPDLKTVSDRGFVYEGNNPTPADAGWATQYNGLLRIAGGDHAPLMQRYTLDLRAQQGNGNVEPWAEFLFYNSSAPVADYRTALSLKTTGDGQVAMRSSWSTDAVWSAFQAGPYTGFPDSSEEFFDEGSLTIQRGNVPFLVNAWGALMRHTPGTTDGNDVFNDVYNELFSDQSDGVHSGRRIFNTYYAVRAGGYWGQIGNGPGSTTTLSRFEEGGGYGLMRGTHLESQYLTNHPITGWTRNVVYLRPQLFVVYDRTALNTANVDNWMAWHVASTPVEQLGAALGTHRFDVVDTRVAFGGNLFRGRVTTVLPAGHTVTAVNVFGRGKVYRLEVRSGTPAAAATWLTVFDASASASAAANVTPLSAAAGNVIDGAVEGTVILGATGNNLAVLFSKSGNALTTPLTFSIPAAATYCLATDLQPNTGYAANVVTANGNLTVQFAVGGGFTTTANGTLALNLSADGTISAP